MGSVDLQLAAAFLSSLLSRGDHRDGRGRVIRGRHPDILHLTVHDHGVRVRARGVDNVHREREGHKVQAPAGEVEY